MICYVCSKDIPKTSKSLFRHAKRDHGMDVEAYIIASKYLGIAPKCECGSNQTPLFLHGKFSRYTKGHDSIEHRINGYLATNGYPICKFCKGNSTFTKRGHPKTFCSQTCAAKALGSLSDPAVKAKIKATVLSKYGVDNIGQHN